MITLNSDHGFRQVKDWSEITEMPGFQKDLDPSQRKLQTIVGRYAFPDKVPCGLSTCHRPHGKGYVVRTVDGALTNIGKDCGKTHFGVDFEDMSKTFERDLLEQERRSRLLSFSLQTDAISARVHELRKEEKGADWIHEKAMLLKSPNVVPQAILRKLDAMKRGRTGLVTQTRMATKIEADAREAAGEAPPYFVEDVIADIAGIEALYDENDLRKLLVLEVQQPIRDFDKVEIGSLAPEALRHWVKFADSVEPTLERAVQAIAYGRKLLVSDNLKPLINVMDVRSNQREPDFVGFLKTLS